MANIELVHSYDPLLFIGSVAIAAFAGYVALWLIGRVPSIESREQEFWWLFAASAAMGIGIWSMHFTGMLALRLPAPVGYEPGLTLLSTVIAVAVSLLALAVVRHEEVPPLHLAGASVLTGVEIAGMHYTGMVAVRTTGEDQPGAGRHAGLWSCGAGGDEIFGIHASGGRGEGPRAVREGPVGGDRPLPGREALPDPDRRGDVGRSPGRGPACPRGGPHPRRGIRSDVTGQKEFQETLEHRSLHDQLTGLPNRTLFWDRSEHALERVRRTEEQIAVGAVQTELPNADRRLGARGARLSPNLLPLPA